MDVRCLKCKGRGFCGRTFCPHVQKSKAQHAIQERLELINERFCSSVPTPFIGRVGYPHINVGILSPPQKEEDAWDYDAPRNWANKSYEIPQIIELRSSLINSREQAGVLETNRFIDLVQEVGMASKPVDVEVSLKKRPVFSMKFDSFLAPTGPAADIKNAVLESNPTIPRAVETVVSDTDLKANSAVLTLYNKGFDEHFLSKLLSVGTVGVKKRRKLVPTRWSITAIDDNVGKDIIERIRDLQTADTLAYYGGYLGNFYLVMLFPEVWSYELYEIYMPKASWNTSDELQYSTDFEGFSGRTNYAENCAGGYYAARLPILEKLRELKRQAGVLVFRFITGDYTTPLGVWVCREAVRKAMQNEPLQFSDMDLMLRYAEALVKKKFGHEISPLLRRSLLIRNITSQSKLNQFF